MEARGSFQARARNFSASAFSSSQSLDLPRNLRRLPTRAPLPLRLQEDSGALKLLQRIRDEAHRFANSFHSLLLKKRISESLLDEIPGVSESRKKALLETFGSVERIRKSSVEEISSSPA